MGQRTAEETYHVRLQVLRQPAILLVYRSGIRMHMQPGFSQNDQLNYPTTPSDSRKQRSVHS
jgi:hypothetical protein